MKDRLIVVWRIYEPCNLGCHFCGYSRTIKRDRHVTNPEIILNFGRILADYQKKTGKEVLVSWLGGEPLLWKELASISRIYQEEFAIKLGITTNGTTLDRENIRSTLIDHYSLVTVSIDGFAGTHDFHRGEQGLFDKIKGCVAELVKEIHSRNSPLKLRINTILMRENVHEFEAFCREMAAWGIRELTFNQLGGIDRPEFYPDHRLLPDQAMWFAKEFPRIQRQAEEKGLRIFGTHQYLDRIIATSRDVAISIDDCNPGTGFLFIDEQNRVSPCNFTTEGYGIPLSDIENIAALMKLPERFRYKQQHERAMPCNNCHSTQVFEKFNA